MGIVISFCHYHSTVHTAFRGVVPERGMDGGRDQEGEGEGKGEREGGSDQEGEGGRETHSIVKSLGKVLFSRSPCCSISFPVSLCMCRGKGSLTSGLLATVVTMG